MKRRHKAILYLTYLIVYSDGEYDESERKAIEYICKQEGITDEDYQQFLIDVQGISEKELYDNSMEMIDQCPSHDDKLSVFAWLYKISEVDGTVHAKEVRFLLYSLKRVGVDFEEVKQVADKLPSLAL